MSNTSMIKRTIALKGEVSHMLLTAQLPIYLFRGRSTVTPGSGYEDKLACIETSTSLWSLLKGLPDFIGIICLILWHLIWFRINPAIHFIDTHCGSHSSEKALSPSLPATLHTSQWGRYLNHLCGFTVFSLGSQCELGRIFCCPL